MALNNTCWGWILVRKSFHILSLLLILPGVLTAQEDTTRTDRRRLNTLMLASGAGYIAGMATLNHVWYKNTERQPFRFFNDNAEWKQVDKAGHFFSSFLLSDLSSTALQHCGIAERKSDVFGAVAGFLLTVPVEIFDGYSDGYGASTGDIIADAAGPVFYFGQKLLWREVRVRPKFSFHRTGYASLRPELLGNDLLSEIVKDYNGQTYWFSFDVDKFTSFPKWLNFAVGYGAHDMVYARDHQNIAHGYDPFRQYYVAIDLDLASIKTHSRWIKALLYLVNTVRLPAPALELSSRGAKFHPFYF